MTAASTTRTETVRLMFDHLRDPRWGSLPIAIPAVLAALASAFEGLTFLLLVPTMRSLLHLENDPHNLLPAVIARHAPGRELLPFVLLAATFFAGTVKVLFVYLSTATTAYLMRSFTGRLRAALYDRYLALGKLFYDQRSLGHLQQVLTTYVGVLSQGMTAMQGCLYSFCTLVVYLAIMFGISWRLTLASLTVLPVLHITMRSLIRRLTEISRDYSDRFNDLGTVISNALMRVPLIKAYTNESEELGRFLAANLAVTKLEFQIENRVLMVGPLQEFLLLVMLVTFLGIISLVGSGNSPSELSAYLVFLLVMKRATTQFGVFNAVRTALASVSGPVAEIAFILYRTDGFRARDGSRNFEGLRDKVELRGLSFTFPEGAEVLHGVDLVVTKGETVGLVGSSGSGKSTIINLLMRLYEPPQGTLLADGEDVNDFTLASWRSRIALVSQDTYLGNETLRENLLYGLRRDVSAEELTRALERSRLAALVATLPAGLETIIGDRGVKLSGGERQRVAIARAILKQADILLLDEATSALDSVTERDIQTALDELIEGRTCLVVAHRLSTLRRADRIVVLERGSVVEEGTFTELVSREGAFARYWSMQQLSVEEARAG